MSDPPKKLRAVGVPANRCNYFIIWHVCATHFWRSIFGALTYIFNIRFRYDLLEFSQVVQAVKDGNLLMLNEALDKNEKFFIRCGIFLILEKLKIITYRYLCVAFFALSLSTESVVPSSTKQNDSPTFLYNKY